MVDGFKDKDGKFRPTDRSAVPSLTVRELLPKAEMEEEKERQSERLGKFAKLRASKFGKGASQVSKGAKVTGGLLKAGGEKIKQRQIRKSAEEQETREELEKRIDDILDEVGASDSRKFRRLQTFGLLQRTQLSKRDLKLVNDALKELDERIKRDREGKQLQPETGGITQPQRVGEIPTQAQIQAQTPEGISAEQFAKLPDELKEKVRVQVGG